MKLVVSGALPGGLDQIDEDIRIEIDSIYNPLSMNERQFAAALGVKSKRDGNQYNIQQGTFTWKATKPTSISQVSITSTSTVVQEYVRYSIRFRPDVEIEAGAHAMLQFPKGASSAYFSFDNRLNSMTTIGGLFGSRQDNVAFKQDGANLKIETKAGTRRYSSVGVATMQISYIKNPAYRGTFGSFSIVVYDKNKERIAEVKAGLTYTTTPGTVRRVELYPANPYIDSTSTLFLRFQPVHKVAKNSKLKLELSRELAIPCPADWTYNSGHFVRPLKVDCEERGDKATGYHEIMIDGPYVNDYEYSQHTVLQLAFPGTRLPGSSRQVRRLRISTLTLDDKGVYQPVDYYSSNVNLFAVQAAPFFHQQVRTLKTSAGGGQAQVETYTDSVFEFSLTLANTIFSGAYIDIVLPPEVKLPAGGSVVAKAVRRAGATELESSTKADTPVTAANGSVTIRVRDFVESGGNSMAKNSKIVFALSKLQTPLTTKSSGSFRVYTKDKDGYIVNYVVSDLFVTMLRGRHIPSLRLASASKVVGQRAAHALYFQTPVPLQSNDTLMVIYPPGTFPPLTNGRCEGNETLRRVQQCTVIQDVVQTSSLAFRAAGGATPTSRPAGSRVGLTIFDSLNPQTGKRTDIYKVYVKDVNGYVKSEMTKAGFTAGSLLMTTPSPISTF